MPILRYFLFVGGALFALLVLADAVLPSVPLPANLTSASDLPPVRIQSARKWPERIVMDTSIAPPASVALAKLEQPAPAATAELPKTEPSKTSARDAYAQMSRAGTGPSAATPKASEKPHATRLSEASARAAETKKRKSAKAPPGRPMILVAQQPHFGLFGSTW
ncbi:conserved exported protein of unknown function (signalP) [Bradyrhizobium sp. ORS 285]|nr:conserved exported hypothetical protein (signalP) [Bradyrhizobium sp. ORS 285]SMX58124.1 conserved exported protein of unknown function (signalP) [Bradyrhizobium sp. ORS 285]